MRIWESRDDNDGDNNPCRIVWVHRDAINEAITHANYTAVISNEDDHRITWPALVSWAIDIEILEPLGFTYCFYRTEVSQENGSFNLLDWTHSHNLTESPLVDMQALSPSAFRRTEERTRNSSCGILPNVECWKYWNKKESLKANVPLVILRKRAA